MACVSTKASHGWSPATPGGHVLRRLFQTEIIPLPGWLKGGLSSQCEFGLNPPLSCDSEMGIGSG